MNTENKAAQEQAPIQSGELAELKRLAEAATAGPWSRGFAGAIFCAAGYGVASGSINGTWTRNHNSDEKFIAAANPATILRLLDSLDHAHAALYAGVADRAAVPAAQQQAQSVPDVLFDGYAVYAEITRKLGKSHCIQHTAVSATLDAAVRLIRAAAPPAATPVLDLNKLTEIIRGSGYVTWSQACDMAELVADYLSAPQGERETEQKQGA